MKRFFILVIFSIGFVSTALTIKFIYPTNVNAAKSCEIIVPGSINYGDEIEITTLGPGISKVRDYNKTEILVKGTTTKYSHTFTGINQLGRDVQVKIHSDDPNYPPPKNDSSGNPTPEAYEITAKVVYADYVNPIFNGGDLVKFITTTCTGPNLMIIPSEKSFTPNDPLPQSDISLGYSISAYQGDSKTEIIDGLTSKVDILFHGLNPNEKYKVCYSTDFEKDCISKDKFNLDGDKRIQSEDGTYLLKDICGGGKHSVKIPSLSDDEGKCNPEKDYFHEGEIYRVSLFPDNYEAGPTTAATFYVRHRFPLLIFKTIENSEIRYVSPDDPTGRKVLKFFLGEEELDEKLSSLYKEYQVNNPLSFTINHAVKAGGWKRNNYQVTIQSRQQNMSGDKCVATHQTYNTSADIPVQLNFGSLTEGNYLSQIPQGEYIIKINEQVDEDGLLKTGIGNDCKGGFTYYEIPLRVVVEKNKKTNTFNTNAYIDLSGIKYDPKGIESQQSVLDSEEFGSLPCTGGITAEGTRVTVDPNATPEEISKTISSIVECTQYATAIGSFGTDPLGFISTLGTWLFRIATISTFALMIYAGILFQLSRGDKEKIGKAREIITAAITGLIFLILSVSILQIIGIDILKIPGFTRDDNTSQQSNSNTN